jgi:hypothetical protein
VDKISINSGKYPYFTNILSIKYGYLPKFIDKIGIKCPLCTYVFAKKE